MKFIKTIIGILIIPIAVGTAQAFYSEITSLSIFSGMLLILERGVLFYLIFHVMIMRPAYIYVLAHEVVHVLATWLCGGKIVSFNVTPGGGDVVTSKSNFFIELSPYFVPLYTILLGPLYLILRSTRLGIPHLSSILLFLVGVTLAFHFVMTSEIIRIEQPDIVKSGLIFSLALIFIGNLVITMAVFAPLFDSLAFVSFIKESVIRTGEIYRLVYGESLELINSMKGL